MTDQAPPIPKLGLTRTECAKAMGVGVRMVDHLIAGRRDTGFPVCFIRTKPIVPTEGLVAWLARNSASESGQ